MEFDLMAPTAGWAETAELARTIEAAGFSGMLFTETSQTPWGQITAASLAAPTLQFCTGIAVAFPRSPMIAASQAWELAENTRGKFRLGLGSQVRAHVKRRYGAEFNPPGPRLRDYVAAVKACLRAFRGDEPLHHEGPYYDLSLLPPQWAPRRHEWGDVKVDISAVGPYMCRLAGELADGVHVHPLHSMHYLRARLLPGVAEGAARAGRSTDDVDLIVPVFAIPCDTPEERAVMVRTAKTQIGFYGSTANYAFQFDDLGYPGTSAELNRRLKAGDLDGVAATITDEMLDHFAVIAPWDELADRLLERYRGVAARVVMYLAVDGIRKDPSLAGRWGEIARAVRAVR